MAIRMRENNKTNAECIECGCEQSKALKLFDLCIGGEIFTICDDCNNKLFIKTLKADGIVSKMPKSPKQIKIINARNHKKHKYQEVSINDI